MVCLEKLVCEVLGHEGKHQIGPLRIWPEFLSSKKPLSHHFWIRKNRFTCRENKHVKDCFMSTVVCVLL